MPAGGRDCGSHRFPLVARLCRRIACIVDARALLIGEGIAAPAGICLPCVADPTPSSASLRRWRILPRPRPPIWPRFSSPPAPPAIPKGVTITHRNILANLEPIDAGIAKYRRYIRLFSPIRFLNLLPLSHMFGQSMAAFIPPMIAGEVYFMSGYSPRDVAHLIHRRRISVLVCVPQMLELLRDYIVGVVPKPPSPRAAPNGT